MRTEPAPGSDPEPAITGAAAEDDPRSWGDAEPAGTAAARDDELRRDKPPHWG